MTRGLILTYHRVTSIDRDPLSMTVSPERFSSHLGVLRTLAACVPLSEVGSGSQRTVAITIDDGYADAAEVASSLLERDGFPATLFVTSDVLEGDNEFWWDALEHVLLDGDSATDALRLNIDDLPLRVDVRTLAGRQRALRALNHRLRPLPADRIDQYLHEVAEQLGADVPACTDHRRLSTEQVRAIDQGGVVEIGAHTRSHTMLTALDRDGQRHEIAGSRRTLADLLGHPIRSFAYPFGTPTSFDATTVEVIREAGYERACVNTGGLVSRRSDRFRLPRYPVYDWPAEEFRQRVEAWFAGR